MKQLKVKDEEKSVYLNSDLINRIVEVSDSSCTIIYPGDECFRNFNVPWNATELIKEIYGNQSFKIIDCTVARDKSKSKISVSDTADFFR